MKSEYSFDHFQKRRKKIQEKNKRTKKRLLVLFLTTFSTVLMMFLVLANIITPTIDIPALNNNYDKMTDIRSSDFKKRIDSRLEKIKVDDDSPTRIVEKPQEVKTEKTNEPNAIESFFANAEKIKDDIIKLDFPADNQPPPVPGEVQQAQKAEEITLLTPPKIVQKPNIAPAPPAPYMPTMPARDVRYRVLVGQFNSPQEAKALSEKISNQNTMVRPFIKNYRGRYCVQIGTYNDQQKAQSIAGKYSGARVVRD